MKSYILIEDKNNNKTGGNVIGLKIFKYIKKSNKRTFILDFENDLKAFKILGERFFMLFNFFRAVRKIPSNSNLLFVYFFDFASLWILLISFFKKNKNVVSFHTNFKKPGLIFSFFYSIKKIILINSACIFSDKIIFLTQAQKKYFNNFCFLKNKLNKKSSINFNFIDDELILKKIKKSNKTKKLKILYIGRLTTQKGVNVLIEAIKKNKSIDFTVIGKGCEKFVNLIKNKKNVRYIKEIDNNKIIEIYRENDVLLLPSYSEVFPMVILEAMSQGLVILVSDIPGMREIVKEKRNGFLFPVGRIEIINKRLKYLSKNRKKIEEIRENNLKDVLEFTESKQLKKYLEIMK
jgi:glycosyltransferase involved in cell wall biosynthesis